MVQGSSNVIRICRPGIVGGVTGIAVRIRQLIVVIDVTLNAQRRAMLSCQREFRCIVVE